MSADSLSLIAGSLLSLAFSYIPGLKAKFDALSTEYKRGVMLGLVLLVAFAIYFLACSPFAMDVGVPITCGKSGMVELIKVIILVAVANQGAYGLTKRE
jgi:hypothetical protein